MAACGFYLDLPDFCSFCAHYAPEVSEKVSMQSFEDRVPKIATRITCKNVNLCQVIARNLEERMPHGKT